MVNNVGGVYFTERSGTEWNGTKVAELLRYKLGTELPANHSGR